jgi:hypothetical protein
LTPGSIAIGGKTHVAEEALGKAVCASKTDLLIAVTIVGAIWETRLDALELVMPEDAALVATSVIAIAVTVVEESGVAVAVATSAEERDVTGVSDKTLASDFGSEVTTTVTVEAVAFKTVESPGALATLVTVGIALKTVAEDNDNDDDASDAVVRTELVLYCDVCCQHALHLGRVGARHAPRHRTSARAPGKRRRHRTPSSRGSDRRACRPAP